jgi:hypothetical protein
MTPREAAISEVSSPEQVAENMYVGVVLVVKLAYFFHTELSNLFQLSA